MTLGAGPALRLARALALMLAALAIGGCASLRETVGGWFDGGKPDAQAAATPGPSAPPAALNLKVEVDAPAPLKQLLERNLDLTRLPALAPGDAVNDTEWARLIDAAPAQARDLLQTEGYFSPNIVVSRQAASAPGEPLLVRLRVTPGPRARISRVTLNVEGALNDAAEKGDVRAAALLEELRRRWPLPANAEFRNNAWSDAKAATLARLRAAGYASAQWSGTAADVDTDAGGASRVRLFLVADSGPLFRAGEIEVEGLQVHEASTVRHLAAFKPGTPLTEALLLDYQERLQKSNLFESVTVTHDTDPAHADAARVLVRLQEQPLQVYTAGVGYSNNTRARATFEQINRRVFGQALRSRASLEYGSVKRLLDAELSTHPGENLRRNVAGVIVERLVSSTDIVLSQRIRLGRAWDAQAWNRGLSDDELQTRGVGRANVLTLERLAFVEVERGVRSTDLQRRVTIAQSANLQYVLRSLDSVVLPTDGWTLSLQGGLGVSHGNLDASGPFGRAYVRFTGYLPLGASWYGQGRIELGQVFHRSDVGAPDSQLFRAGGDDSVRGYAYRSLGPIVDGSVSSGSALGTLSVELARPLSATLPSLWGAVFVDSGSAAASFHDFAPSTGVGFGLRWRSPVGPLRIDLARALDLQRWRLHFSIGVAL